jgi:hypothetical protein
MASKIRTYETMAKRIRDFFADRGIPRNEARKLWNVLSALRGPDSTDFYLKNCTTEVIRHRLLGKRGGELCPSLVSPDDEKKRDRRRDMFQKFSQFDHFQRHARDAFKDMGMEWDKLNPGERE